ncbi:PREDICTED: one cut domain family member 2 [Odobenus rosmarus divergens]|uniref:One cut domain family member 2 n=1 Tax=Odobenus rosmarus divergens TaxID=9708 RepID=A0A9B0H1C0_ODORO
MGSSLPGPKHRLPSRSSQLTFPAASARTSLVRVLVVSREEGGKDKSISAGLQGQAGLHRKLEERGGAEWGGVEEGKWREEELGRACKRKEQEPNKDRNNSQKKSRLVFTDLQRRTLFAIFKENKRPSKEMQITISQQLGLELTTVSNFFMNARRRSLEKWQDDLSTAGSSSTSSTCTKA